MDIDYLFGEKMAYEEGDEVAPGLSVKKVIRCVNCLLPDKFLDSIYCTEKRYWIEENANLVLSHCSLFEIPTGERTYLECEKQKCEGDCNEDCVIRTEE